ncbi:MAG: flavodoxin family protein [Candidatus Methanomethylophilaceae archaeon]|nr:flavodoxin family protein [Candidatus Methanomethylophilaceae archaeon]
MKKLLIINGSPRKKGCDARVCDEISALASKYGYESETVWAYDLQIGGCRACMACKSTQRCVQKDGMNEILDKIRTSDMLIFATPVYFNGETGPMKTFLDRMYPLMRMNPDRTVESFIGNVKKAAIVVCCGAPDGNMKYASIVTKFINVLKMFNVTDVSGAVIPSGNPDTVLESSFCKGCLSQIEFQLQME